MTCMWPLRYAKALSDVAITLVISNIANTTSKNANGICFFRYICNGNNIYHFVLYLICHIIPNIINSNCCSRIF